MKVAFVQFAPRLSDLPANVAAIRRLAPQFAGADLVVLPELANSGYNFPSQDAALACGEAVDASPFLDALQQIATQAGQHIVTGLCERADDRLYNSAVLLGPDGVIGTYRKLHLFVDEKDFFTPGDVGLPVCEIPGARVGMLICFDWIFPEAWRVLALKGADVICHPANLVIPGKCQSVVPAQATCNRIYIVTANRIGNEGALTFTGNSIIAAPDGSLLQSAPADRECVRLAEIDPALARDKQITRRNDVFGDRRPAEYRSLVEHAGEPVSPEQ
jgi:predicted amidohydrolase